MNEEQQAHIANNGLKRSIKAVLMVAAMLLLGIAGSYDDPLRRWNG